MSAHTPYRWKVGDPHPTTVAEYWLQLARDQRAFAETDRRNRRCSVESIQVRLKNAEDYEARAAAIAKATQP